MPGGHQTIDDRVDHIAMSGKKFAAGRGNLDADLVLRRNQRSPGGGESDWPVTASTRRFTIARTTADRSGNP